MNFEVQLQVDEPFEVSSSTITNAAATLLKSENAPDGALSIIFTSEAIIQELNRKFADIDEPTDVLSFEDGGQNPESGLIYFGDVIVAVPVAQRQAEHAGHPLEIELVYLTLHGILHLLGYDHHDSPEKERMWAKQSKTMIDLGFGAYNLEALR